MIFGIIFNIITTTVYYLWFNKKVNCNYDDDFDEHPLDLGHMIMYWLSLALLAACLPLFVASICLNPGYITHFYEFTKLVEVALDIGLHLDNFCSYCEIIKSETSFHCTFCHKCVEHFDHHCPFINNCLGYRNHKYFLTFIFLYTLYLLCLLEETLRHFIEMIQLDGISCVYNDSLTTVNLVLILLHLPLFFY